MARFLENHDEPRAAAAFAPGMHEAAAVITFLSPGLRFLHQGQFEGQWRLLECAAAWDGNWTSDCFIAWSWEARDGQRILIAVNYAGNRSQCYVRLPFPELSGHTVRLRDQMGSASYDRDGSDLVSQGLYLDLPPLSYHVFEMSAR